MPLVVMVGREGERLVLWKVFSIACRCFVDALPTLREVRLQGSDRSQSVKVMLKSGGR